MFSLRKFGVTVAAIALASLAGCGQYGPLYLPSKALPPDASQGAPGSAPSTSQGRSRGTYKDGAQDDTQDNDFNAQPPALDKSRQP